jgi:Ca-activated chloride channel homolog
MSNPSGLPGPSRSPSPSTRPFWVLSAFISVLAAFPLSAEEAPRTVIVLDASGSMWGRIVEEPKILVARKAVHNLLDGIDQEAQVGLVAYGHRRKSDCSDIEVLVPVGGSRDDVRKAVDKTKPKGKDAAHRCR